MPTPTTRVQLVLDIEYELIPNKYNKIEIEKILAIMCHQIQKENLYSWKDVSVSKYKYNINTNPYYKSRNNFSQKQKTNFQKKEKTNE
jgi:hypothetical protein